MLNRFLIQLLFIPFLMCLGLPLPLVRADDSLAHRLKLDSFRESAPELVIEATRPPARRLSDFRGHPLLLHIWASWCPSCAQELPLLAALAARSEGAGVAFLAVSVDPVADHQKVSRSLKTLGVKLPDWIAANSEQVKPYWAWGVPMTYLIGSDGKIIWRAAGPRDWSTVSGKDLESLFRKP
jgi:thiol-disulfide isomerase/thioredoxin